MGKKRAKLLSEQLRAAVDSSDWSRQEICDRMGIDKAALSRFMAGKSGLRLANLDALATLLNLELTKSGQRGR